MYLLKKKSEKSLSGSRENLTNGEREREREMKMCLFTDICHADNSSELHTCFK